MSTVQWEQMTVEGLIASAKACGGVCLLPIGSLEKHAYHLPLGTDTLVAQRVCVAAAQREPAVVFPAQCLGQVSEGRCHVGGVAITSEVMLRMWEQITDDIARNGFKKIVLVSWHGGNRFLTYQFTIELLNRRKDYAVYVPKELDDPAAQGVLDTDYNAHASESETSIMLHLHPELVRMDRIGPIDGRPQRDFDLGKVYSSVDWYSQHPQHYGGDARTATAAKGKVLFEGQVNTLVEMVRRIKRDRRVPQLLAEFYDRADKLDQAVVARPARKTRPKKGQR
jgi:creatinine amidohydrolase